MIIQHIFRKNPASVFNPALFSSIRLLFSKDVSFIQLLFMQYPFHHSTCSVYSVLFITSASTYTVFSLTQLLLYKDSFITPASIYAVYFSSLQILFLQCSFHQSRVYLSKESIFNKSQFYWHKILFTHSNFYLRNKNFYLNTQLFSSIQLLLKHRKYIFPVS